MTRQKFPSIPQEQRATGLGFNFIVLNEQEQQWLQRAYPQLKVQKLLADGQAILFARPIDEIYFEEDQVLWGSITARCRVALPITIR